MKPAKWDEPCKISVGIFSFAVWRSDWGTRRRGWCRAEMWCKLLSERSKVPIVATRRLMQWENPRNTGYPQIIHFRFRIFHEINPIHIPLVVLLFIRFRTENSPEPQRRTAARVAALPPAPCLPLQRLGKRAQPAGRFRYGNAGCCGLVEDKHHDFGVEHFRILW